MKKINADDRELTQMKDGNREWIRLRQRASKQQRRAEASPDKLRMGTNS